MSVSLITAETLPVVWEQFRPKIQEALSGGMGDHYSEAYYYQEVLSGRMMMWAMHESEIMAVGIVSVNEFPIGKSLFIELLAGSQLDTWLDEVEPLLKEYARQIGATTIEASCRPGLAKKLKNWRQVAILMRLDHGR